MPGKIKNKELWRRKISVAMKGRKLSEDHKRNLSKAKKGKPILPQQGFQKGHPSYWTKESIERMRQTILSKRLRKTCPICNKEFSVPPSRNRTYCSPECRYKSPIVRQKLSKGNKGKKRSEEIKNQLRERALKLLKNNPKFGVGKRKAHWAWKGGICSENYKLRRSRKFQNWRKKVFKRDNYTCWICGDRSGNGHRVTLHPHHLKRFADNPELRFNLNNGITLCDFCHRTYTKFGEILCANLEKLLLKN